MSPNTAETSPSASPDDQEQALIGDPTNHRLAAQPIDALPQFTSSPEEALELFIERVRDEARRGPVRQLIALIAADTAGWRTVVLDMGGINDLDTFLIWGVNRMARIIDARIAVYVEERPHAGAVVFVERFGAAVQEVHTLGRGDRHELTYNQDECFDILPGGPKDEGWGREDHDELNWW
jgi:hypothetical protein